jgi:hypothetical protein
MADATPDMTKLSGEMYKAWESSMTQWWDQVLESPAFLKGLGENLSQQTQARKTYEDQVDQNLESWHLPTRSDLVRVTRIATMLEDRVLGLEDKLLAMEDRMVELQAETLKARVDAAEARVSSQEQLAEINAKLEALLAQTAPKPAAPKKPAPRRSRATKKES